MEDKKLQELEVKVDMLLTKMNFLSYSDLATDKKESKPKWESILSSISIAAIPVVIAVGGWLIQRRLQDQAIQRDYVQLSVEILKESDTAKTNVDLRNWAVELLNQNAPVKLNQNVKDQLKSGKVSLPSLSAEPSKYSPSARSLNSLQPQVMELAKKFIAIAREQGIEVMVLKTRVSQKEQEELYAVGRTEPGNIVTYAKTSAHVKGLAFDVVPMKDGNANFDDDEAFKKLNIIGDNLGLKHSDFDKGHFELKVAK